MSRVNEPLNPTEAHVLQPWVTHCMMKNEDDKETLLERMSEAYKALQSLAAKQDEQARQSVTQNAAVERYLSI